MKKRAAVLPRRLSLRPALSDMRLRRGLGAVALPSALITPLFAGIVAFATFGLLNMGELLH